MRHRFLTPKWLLGHALVLAVLIGFPTLGVWQLDRHQDATEREAEQRERLDAPPLGAEALEEDPEALRYHEIELQGRWRPDDELLLSPRPLGGEPGHHVLTPFEAEDGRTVLVDRGWVPQDVEGPPVAEAPPPDGEVTLRGELVDGESARRIGPREGERATGAGPDAAEVVSAPDPEAVAGALGEDLPPVVVYAREGAAAGGADVPRPPAVPDHADVDHFSYAMQWFIFTTVVAGGYPVLLWRVRRAG